MEDAATDKQSFFVKVELIELKNTTDGLKVKDDESRKEGCSCFTFTWLTGCLAAYLARCLGRCFMLKMVASKAPLIHCRQLRDVMNEWNLDSQWPLIHTACVYCKAIRAFPHSGCLWVLYFVFVFLSFFLLALPFTRLFTTQASELVCFTCHRVVSLSLLSLSLSRSLFS